MSFRFAFKTSFGHLQDVLARCLACLEKTSCRCLFADWVIKNSYALETFQNDNQDKPFENSLFFGKSAGSRHNVSELLVLSSI